MTLTCATCLFFAEHPAIAAGHPLPAGVSLHSRCRRYPVSTPTTAADWCGEHGVNAEPDEPFEEEDPLMATGTRTNALDQQSVRPAQSHLDRTLTRDAGMTKLVTGALVFSTVPPRVTLAGVLGPFTVTDQVLVEGTGLNNGIFAITGLGAGNYLTLDPPPKAEAAPATAVMRST